MVKSSCLWLKGLCEMCLQCLFKLSWTGFQVGKIWTNFFFVKQECVTCDYRPVPAILYAAYLPLGYWNWWISFGF